MKGIFNLVLLVLLLCNISFVSLAYASDSDVICNSCVTENDFINLAKSLPQGNVVIINPDHSLAYSYKVVIEPLDGAFLIPRIVPSEVFDAIEKYQSIKQSFSAFSRRSKYNPLDSSTDTIPNGCGAEGSWTSEYIPNEPFGVACDRHDICYGSFTAKSICDTAFLNDMHRILDELLANTNKWEEMIMRVLYTIQATEYHFAVDKFGNDAYCAGTANTNAAECAPFEPPEWALNGNMTPKVNGVGNIVYTMNCELWSFPDGNGGQYTLLRNCTVTSYQD